MKKLRKYWLLSSDERWLLIQATVLLMIVRLGLWLLPFRWLNALSQRMLAKVSKKSASITIFPDHVVNSVEIATRHLPGRAKCLARALSTQLLLSWYGYTGNLRIGVARNCEEFTAHAWVELGGQVLIGGDSDLSLLTPLPSINL